MIRRHSQLPGGTRACDRERGMRAMRVTREKGRNSYLCASQERGQAYIDLT